MNQRILIAVEIVGQAAIIEFFGASTLSRKVIHTTPEKTLMAFDDFVDGMRKEIIRTWENETKDETTSVR